MFPFGVRYPVPQNGSNKFGFMVFCALLLPFSFCNKPAPDLDAKLAATRAYYDSPAIIGAFLDPKAFGTRKWHATFQIPDTNGKWMDETEYLLRYANLSEKSKILDWGCGMGWLVVKIAKQCHCSVTGINVSAKQLEKASLWAKQNGVAERTSFVLYDGKRLPFADATFSAVFSQEALVNAPDKYFAYSELYRVLRPGGDLSIQDWYADESVTDWAKLVQKIDYEHKSTLISIQKSERIFKEVGFRNIEVFDVRSSIPDALTKAFPNDVFRAALDKKAFTVGFIHASK